MLKIIKALIILISLTLSSRAFACSCEFLGEISIKDIEEYDYIALVKVMKVYPVLEPESGFENSFEVNFKMDIEEIQHYKGANQNSLVINGGNYLSQIKTSCDFGMKENQEWVIFGRNIDGGIIVQPCSRTTNYKAEDGQRDWQFRRGFKGLDFLDSAFKFKKEPTFPHSGADTIFFDNGKPERILNFKKGEREGDVIYYFPDGKIYGEGSYKKGKLDGEFNWYNRLGGLQFESTYKEGYEVGESTYYFPIGNGVLQPRMKKVYNKKGKLTNSIDFAPGKKGWYMSSETCYDQKKQVVVNNYYDENGKLKSRETLKNGIQIEYKKFKEDQSN
jgi:antitoxin component YwqK of YwqJK toxin-antitoxin module